VNAIACPSSYSSPKKVPIFRPNLIKDGRFRPRSNVVSDRHKPMLALLRSGDDYSLYQKIELWR
jgi:hypothetical protein